MRKWIASAVVSVSLAAAMPVMLAPSSALAAHSHTYRKIWGLLNQLTLEDLIDLRSEVTRKILASEDLQKVTVPPGVYKVGTDIPAGKWTIRAASPEGSSDIYYFEKPNNTGMFPDVNYPFILRGVVGQEIHAYDQSLPESTDIDAAAGWYIMIVGGNSVFSPSIGSNLDFH